MRGPRHRGRRIVSAALAATAWLAGSSISADAPPIRRDARTRRVYVGNPAVTLALHASLDGAGQRLKDPQCRAVLSSPRLRDRAGRPLTEKLDTLSLNASEYLDLIVFLDGSAEPQCRGSALAFTEPGSRVVYVCGLRFWRAWTNRPQYAQAAVIHEALHTLGLPENPPSSAFITQEVLETCYR